MSLSAPSISAVGALILSSLFLELTSSPREELLTECICWLLILFCGKSYLYLRSEPSRPFSNTSELGAIAFGATLLCLTGSIQRMTWSTAPLLAPALIMIERGSSLLPEYEDSEGKDMTPQSGNKRKGILLWVYAGVTMIALFRGDPLDGFRLKLCWLFAQIVLYWGLSHRIPKSGGLQSEITSEVLHTATELATFMVLITAPLVALWWHQAPSIPQVGMVSIVKACHWIAILVLAHGSRLTTSAWTTIFAVCTNEIWVHPHGWQAGVTLMGALAALYRVAAIFPQSSLGKLIALAFALCPLWAFGVHTEFNNRRMPTISLRPIATTWGNSHHPIYLLAEEAKGRFEKTQLRQSRSLTEAVAEYRKRYGRAPPPGFNEWYEFAVKNDVQWIDEYDFLTRSLDPYWKMPPHVLREYVDQALALEGETRFNTLVIKDQKASLSQGSFQHRQLVELIQPIMEWLPDLKAILNEPDEPRILVPWSEFHGEDSYRRAPPDAQTQPVYFNYQHAQIVWDSITLPCSPESRARSALIEPKSSDSWPPFVSNLTESQDLCQLPATDSKKHGFLSSPSTFSYTQRLVPIMSTAKLSTFHDIMIPSSYYYQPDIAEYDESKDIPFATKKDVVYWRGSGTGGHWTHGSWKMGHRQRFVNFTNSPEAEITLLQETPRGKLEPYQTEMGEQQMKFDIKFTGWSQCEQEDCDAQEEYFHRAAHDHNNDANQYKIIYNLDGNSFSGRYYRFLKSNSLVFMQAMFKEWHDDRILPWVHFIPIGLSLEDLPEAARYFLDNPEGQVLAARIASESREWSRRVLRKVDLTAAYYRVFLEYARLLDDDRDKFL